MRFPVLLVKKLLLTLIDKKLENRLAVKVMQLQGYTRSERTQIQRIPLFLSLFDLEGIVCGVFALKLFWQIHVEGVLLQADIERSISPVPACYSAFVISQPAAIMDSKREQCC